MSSTPIFAHINRQTLDTPNPAPYIKGVKRGVSEELVRQISKDKGEPQWMLKHRLESLNIFYEKEMPEWGADLSLLNLDDIIYYARQGAENTDNWGNVPEEIRNVYDRLGIPEAERKVLAGVGAQYESEVIYHK